MSGEHTITSSASPSVNTRLRACEACNSRKIRCDRLTPCSACRSASIPCRTASHPPEKRQRVVISTRYEEQIEQINTQLLQLQRTLDTLIKGSVQVGSQHSLRPFESVRQDGPYSKQAPAYGPESSPSQNIYFGEASFEVHSQQTSKILENVLNNSSASTSNHDLSSTLKSLRDLVKNGNSNNITESVNNLPMIPAQTALAVLRIIDISENGMFLCGPTMDPNRLKQICQRVFFPIGGYSRSDFIVANGGLVCILANAGENELKTCNIDPATAAEAMKICESNVSCMIESFSPFMEPTVANIEAILFAFEVIAVVQSNHHLGWNLISMAARLCLDSGLNQLKDSMDDPELEVKKSCFWLTYSTERALSLNFGRPPTLSDVDITTGYPASTSGPFYSLHTIWLDLARIQGQIYNDLYSARGRLESPEARARTARMLASELKMLQDRSRATFRTATGQEDDHPYLDPEMTILSNLTLTYRALPTDQPPYPLRFPEECITAAREALQLHQRLCARFLTKSDSSLRTYIEWNLSFCSFTPFIVILGTAILSTRHDDIELLKKVVESLERASIHTSGAKKLHRICNVLFKGAQLCIRLNLSNEEIPSATNHRTSDTYQSAHTDSATINNWESSSRGAVQNSLNMEPLYLDNQESLQIGSTDDMSMLFDNYLGGVNMMPLFEGDFTQFDTSPYAHSGTS